MSQMFEKVEIVNTKTTGTPNSGHFVRRLQASENNLGLSQFLHYVARWVWNRVSTAATPYRLYSKYSTVPLWLRPHTSDIDVFDQIFRYREYRCLDDLPDAELIIDCGANVGFSSAYFLSRFPRSKVVAVEPDPENFAAMERNLAPFAERVTALCTGVWSSECGLVLCTDGFGDDREWARTVRAAHHDEKPMMAATDIGTLFKTGSSCRISILKIDIEGSELEVFSSGSTEWLEYVDNIVIELHGKECERVFMDAIAGRGFEISRCDELTVCKRRGSMGA